MLIQENGSELNNARRCWLAKDTQNVGLAIIFANGWSGVKRDYDAATYFLCRANKGDEDEPVAAAELWSMAGFVQQMRVQDVPHDLNYCEHITSGRGDLYCSDIEAAKKETASSGGSRWSNSRWMKQAGNGSTRAQESSRYIR